jgi:hypothetical protein
MALKTLLWDVFHCGRIACCCDSDDGHNANLQPSLNHVHVSQAHWTADSKDQALVTALPTIGSTLSPQQLRRPPAKKVREWTVKIDRGIMPLGLTLAWFYPHVVLIETIKEGGALAMFNARNPRDRIMPGDVILDCNDVVDDSRAIIEVLRSAQQLRFTVRRVSRFQASVRSGETLGMKLDRKSMSVLDIYDGTCHRYNMKAEPGFQIMVNDCIVEVGGQTGSSDDLWRRMFPVNAASNAVQLTIERPEGEYQRLGATGTFHRPATGKTSARDIEKTNLSRIAEGGGNAKGSLSPRNNGK